MNWDEFLNNDARALYHEVVLSPSDHEPLLRSPRLSFASIGPEVYPVQLETPVAPNASTMATHTRIERQAALDWLLNLRAVDDHVYQAWVDDLRETPDQLMILMELVHHASERIGEIMELIEDVLAEGQGDPENPTLSESGVS